MSCGRWTDRMSRGTRSSGTRERPGARPAHRPAPPACRSGPLLAAVRIEHHDCDETVPAPGVGHHVLLLQQLSRSWTAAGSRQVTPGPVSKAVTPNESPAPGPSDGRRNNSTAALAGLRHTRAAPLLLGATATPVARDRAADKRGGDMRRLPLSDAEGPPIDTRPQMPFSGVAPQPTSQGSVEPPRTIRRATGEEAVEASIFIGISPGNTPPVTTGLQQASTRIASGFRGRRVGKGKGRSV